ncbi:MAG: response regulator, partial [Solirubrobacterales bacterium]|nr:response regulator [Solirubrobacterales bacterium]
MSGRILIAEDDAGIAAFLDKGLRANGFATKLVADGESAHAFARSGEFDLLVLDIGLPQRDGFTVLRQL